MRHPWEKPKRIPQTAAAATAMVTTKATYAWTAVGLLRVKSTLDDNYPRADGSGALFIPGTL